MGLKARRRKSWVFFGKLFKFGGMIKNIPGMSDLAGDLAEELDLPEELGEFAGDLADAVGEMGDEMPDIEGMRGGLKKAGKMGEMEDRLKMPNGAFDTGSGISLPEDMGDAAGIMDDAMDMSGKLKKKSPGEVGERAVRNLPHDGMTEAGKDCLFS